VINSPTLKKEQPMKQQIQKAINSIKEKNAEKISNVVSSYRKALGVVTSIVSVTSVVSVTIALSILFMFREPIKQEVTKKFRTYYHNTITSIQIEDDTQTLKEKEDERVGQYALLIMGMHTKMKMSDFQKQLMAQTIVRVSGNVFDNEDERKWFIILINNESAFDKNAKSPVGAVGLTQVMPQFIEEFGGHCGLKDVNTSEVFDMEVNLTLGACRFKHLLNSYSGVYSTALAAYNGGKNAKSVKEIQAFSKITTQETLQYIARFTHIKATADAKVKENDRMSSNQALMIPITLLRNSFQSRIFYNHKK
jgi:hypothetical protein